jgi:hypothetical protein
MTPPFSYISVIISGLKRAWPFIWTNLNSLHQRIICTKFDWLVLQKKIFQIFLCIFILLLLSPLGEELSPSFKDTWILSLQGWFVPSLVKIGPVVLEKKIFKWPHFYIFVIISPLKRTWPFIWTNLNSLHSRIICTKFDWFWSSGSGEEDFSKFSVYFYSFAIISPLRGAITFLWTNLNSLDPRIICAKSG